VPTLRIRTVPGVYPRPRHLRLRLTGTSVRRGGLHPHPRTSPTGMCCAVLNAPRHEDSGRVPDGVLRVFIRLRY